MRCRPLRDGAVLRVALGDAEAGLVAWWRRPGSSFGALLLATGLLWLAAGLVNVEQPALVAVGLVMSVAPSPRCSTCCWPSRPGCSPTGSPAAWRRPPTSRRSGWRHPRTCSRPPARPEGYVDPAGAAGSLPSARAGRGVSEVELDGRVVGVIAYDAGLLADPAVVSAAGRVLAIALDRERLAAELRASRQAVRDSRARIVAAGDRERRRVERNLHDGAQQRLTGLALILRLAGSRANGDGEVRGLLGEAERSALPVAIDRCPQERLPEEVEVAAYYVVAEALTNAAKHSGASRVSVGAERRNGLLHVEVSDDGRGGAGARPGSGSEGLRDRVDAVGGHLTLKSPPRAGTRLEVELPCA